MFAGGYVAYKFEHCRDGLSSTYLVGEVLPGLYVHHMLFHSHYNVWHHPLPTKLSPTAWRRE